MLSAILPRSSCRHSSDRDEGDGEFSDSDSLEEEPFEKMGQTSSPPRVFHHIVLTHEKDSTLRSWNDATDLCCSHEISPDESAGEATIELLLPRRHQALQRAFQRGVVAERIGSHESKRPGIHFDTDNCRWCSTSTRPKCSKVVHEARWNDFRQSICKT